MRVYFLFSGNMFVSRLCRSVDLWLAPLESLIRRHQKIAKRILLGLSLATILELFLPIGSLGDAFGLLAWYLLLLVAVVGPLTRITRKRIFGLSVLLRRELGILMGMLAIVHSGTLFAQSIGSTPPTGLYMIGTMVGMFALIFTALLLITSNNWSQRLLGRHWRYLHLSISIIIPLVFIHIVFMMGRANIVDIFLVVIFIVIRGADLVGFCLPVVPAISHTIS